MLFHLGGGVAVRALGLQRRRPSGLDTSVTLNRLTSPPAPAISGGRESFDVLQQRCSGGRLRTLHTGGPGGGAAAGFAPESRSDLSAVSG